MSEDKKWDSVHALFENAPGLQITTLVRLMLAYGEHASGWQSVGGEKILAMATEMYGKEWVDEAREAGFDDLLKKAREGT